MDELQLTPTKPTEIDKLVQLLSRGGVEFIVIGGVAATAHGSAYVTFDLDVAYRRTAENIARLADVVAAIHPYLRGAPPGLPFRWDRETISHGLNFTLITDLGALDLLGEVAGGGTYEDFSPIPRRSSSRTPRVGASSWRRSFA